MMTTALGWSALLVVVVLAALLLVRPLRRALVTKPVFSIYKRVLPTMSDTEKTALEAGTVWWEGDLFSGHPQWEKLLNYAWPRLTPEEQSFLDNETDTLCRLMNDWETTHVYQDMSPEAWKYVKEKGFLG